MTIEIFGHSISITVDNHTRSIVPGSFIAGVWVATDLSGESQEVRDAATGLWTAPVVTAFRDDLAEALGIGKPATGEDINAERQRRVVAGKMIDGIAVTGRDEDARNLVNLALAAQIRIAQGDTTTPTAFRDGNNVDHDLTPPQMLSLWQQSAAYVSDLYTASWVIKAMDPLPEDVTADELWPA